jgi:photosystem II stability/assembly factor-like uncharacterized protein
MVASFGDVALMHRVWRVAFFSTRGALPAKPYPAIRVSRSETSVSQTWMAVFLPPAQHEKPRGVLMRHGLALALALVASGCGGGGGGGDGGSSGGSWLTGKTGALLASSDGTHYEVRTSPTHADLLSLYCIDTIHGWAAGVAGTLIRTLDGGKQWTIEPTGVQATLRAVAFADAQLGLTVGDGGTLLRSSDGGVSWSKVAAPSAQTLRAVAIARDGKGAWAVGDAGTILRSTDGGAHFTQVSAGTSASLRGVRFGGDSRFGVAVGDAGTVLVTNDGGASWRAADPAPGDLHGVSVRADGTRVVAVGAGGLAWRSIDRGASWQEVNTGTAQTLNAIGFSDDGAVGWAVGDKGTIAMTSDGAASFRAVQSPLAIDFSAVEDL